jgi:hypothetical protein
MTHETLKWKLFPFSLIESAKQWYTANIRSVNGDWNNLRDCFCLSFFALSRVCAITGWRTSIDYRKLNKATKKDRFPLPFIDEM